MCMYVVVTKGLCASLRELAESRGGSRASYDIAHLLIPLKQDLTLNHKLDLGPAHPKDFTVLSSQGCDCRRYAGDKDMPESLCGVCAPSFVLAH